MGDPSAVVSFVRSRDAAVFAQIYRRLHRPIRDFCRRRVPSDLVDDAVATTFVTPWGRLDEGCRPRRSPCSGGALVP